MSLEEKTETKGIHEIVKDIDHEISSYDGCSFKSMERRSNISSVLPAGFNNVYLKSSPIEFNLAVSAHLFGFVLFEILSSLVSKVLGFQVWIPIIMTIWAALSMCQAAVTTSVQLGIVRFLLGAAEAGFSPACIDYISLYYSRKELTTRYGVFLALAIIGGAFTSLLAYGILQIKGGPLKNFQIIFLLEGAPTIIIAIIAAVFLTRGPGDARFLTPNERSFTVDRLKPEGGVDEKNKSVMKSQSKSAFSDPRVYGYVLIATAGIIPNNALNIFLPTLVNQLGYDPVTTQLMCVPPFAIATVVMLIFSWIADKYHNYRVRALIIMIADILAIIGSAGMLGTSATNPNLFRLRYFFTTLMACGVFTSQPIVISWLTGNIVGQYKRNVTIATFFTIGNIGSVVGLLVFTKDAAPAFKNGMIICLSMSVVQFVLCFLMKLHLEYENKRRDLVTLAKHNAQLSESELKDTELIKEKAAKLVEDEPKFDEILCDRHPNWRYIS
ncbi:12195_t:CDS:2 [Dentiscutata erythropus]|uniref:12195_t:CDS:1 n=1 Tax=Dentiscutata erythropus TaxID=1348616 RepID=A0A9N9FQN2_9GLOM|nr:12195_t:CDS:2 [Dentiscutata erythropus]